ncbi:hypothetical protein Hdeb2414_s0003g00113581 [Helianthus debilis subsp. tardiflorus]
MPIHQFRRKPNKSGKNLMLTLNFNINFKGIVKVKMFGLIFQRVNLRHGRWKSSLCLYIFSSVRKLVKGINLDCLTLIVGIGGLGIMEERGFNE